MTQDVHEQHSIVDQLLSELKRTYYAGQRPSYAQLKLIAPALSLEDYKLLVQRFMEYMREQELQMFKDQEQQLTQSYPCIPEHFTEDLLYFEQGIFSQFARFLVQRDQSIAQAVAQDLEQQRKQLMFLTSENALLKRENHKLQVQIDALENSLSRLDESYQFECKAHQQALVELNKLRESEGAGHLFVKLLKQHLDSPEIAKLSKSLSHSTAEALISMLKHSDDEPQNTSDKDQARAKAQARAQAQAEYEALLESPVSPVAPGLDGSSSVTGSLSSSELLENSELGGKGDLNSGFDPGNGGCSNTALSTNSSMSMNQDMENANVLGANLGQSLQGFESSAKSSKNLFMESELAKYRHLKFDDLISLQQSAKPGTAQPTNLNLANHDSALTPGNTSFSGAVTGSALNGSALTDALGTAGGVGIGTGMGASVGALGVNDLGKDAHKPTITGSCLDGMEVPFNLEDYASKQLGMDSSQDDDVDEIASEDVDDVAPVEPVGTVEDEGDTEEVKDPEQLNALTDAAQRLPQINSENQDNSDNEEAIKAALAAIVSNEPLVDEDEAAADAVELAESSRKATGAKTGLTTGETDDTSAHAYLANDASNVDSVDSVPSNLANETDNHVATNVDNTDTNAENADNVVTNTDTKVANKTIADVSEQALAGEQEDKGSANDAEHIESDDAAKMRLDALAALSGSQHISNAAQILAALSPNPLAAWGALNARHNGGVSGLAGDAGSELDSSMQEVSKLGNGAPHDLSNPLEQKIDELAALRDNLFEGKDSEDVTSMEIESLILEALKQHIFTPQQEDMCRRLVIKLMFLGRDTVYPQDATASDEEILQAIPNVEQRFFAQAALSWKNKGSTPQESVDTAANNATETASADHADTATDAAIDTVTDHAIGTSTDTATATDTTTNNAADSALGTDAPVAHTPSSNEEEADSAAKDNDAAKADAESKVEAEDDAKTKSESKSESDDDPELPHGGGKPVEFELADSDESVAPVHGAPVAFTMQGDNAKNTLTSPSEKSQDSPLEVADEIGEFKDSKDFNDSEESDESVSSLEHDDKRAPKSPAGLTLVTDENTTVEDNTSQAPVDDEQSDQVAQSVQAAQAEDNSANTAESEDDNTAASDAKAQDESLPKVKADSTFERESGITASSVDNNTTATNAAVNTADSANNANAAQAHKSHEESVALTHSANGSGISIAETPLDLAALAFSWGKLNIQSNKTAASVPQPVVPKASHHTSVQTPAAEPSVTAPAPVAPFLEQKEEIAGRNQARSWLEASGLLAKPQESAIDQVIKQASAQMAAQALNQSTTQGIESVEQSKSVESLENAVTDHSAVKSNQSTVDNTNTAITTNPTDIGTTTTTANQPGNSNTAITANTNTATNSMGQDKVVTVESEFKPAFEGMEYEGKQDEVAHEHKDASEISSATAISATPQASEPINLSIPEEKGVSVAEAAAKLAEQRANAVAGAGMGAGAGTVNRSEEHGSGSERGLQDVLHDMAEKHIQPAQVLNSAPRSLVRDESTLVKEISTPSGDDSIAAVAAATAKLESIASLINENRQDSKSDSDIMFSFNQHEGTNVSHLGSLKSQHEEKATAELAQVAQDVLKVASELDAKTKEAQQVPPTSIFDRTYVKPKLPAEGEIDDVFVSGNTRNEDAPLEHHSTEIAESAMGKAPTQVRVYNKEESTKDAGSHGSIASDQEVLSLEHGLEQGKEHQRSELSLQPEFKGKPENASALASASGLTLLSSNVASAASDLDSSVYTGEGNGGIPWLNPDGSSAAELEKANQHALEQNSARLSTQNSDKFHISNAQGETSDSSRPHALQNSSLQHDAKNSMDAGVNALSQNAEIDQAKLGAHGSVTGVLESEFDEDFVGGAFSKKDEPVQHLKSVMYPTAHEHTPIAKEHIHNIETENTKIVLTPDEQTVSLIDKQPVADVDVMLNSTTTTVFENDDATKITYTEPVLSEVKAEQALESKNAKTLEPVQESGDFEVEMAVVTDAEPDMDVAAEVKADEHAAAVTAALSRLANDADGHKDVPANAPTNAEDQDSDKDTNSQSQQDQLSAVDETADLVAATEQSDEIDIALEVGNKPEFVLASNEDEADAFNEDKSEDNSENEAKVEDEAQAKTEHSESEKAKPEDNVKSDNTTHDQVNVGVSFEVEENSEAGAEASTGANADIESSSDAKTDVEAESEVAQDESAKPAHPIGFALHELQSSAQSSNTGAQVNAAENETENTVEDAAENVAENADAVAENSEQAEGEAKAAKVEDNAEAAKAEPANAQQAKAESDDAYDAESAEQVDATNEANGAPSELAGKEQANLPEINNSELWSGQVKTERQKLSVDEVAKFKQLYAQVQELYQGKEHELKALTSRLGGSSVATVDPKALYLEALREVEAKRQGEISERLKDALTEQSEADCFPAQAVLEMGLNQNTAQTVAALNQMEAQPGNHSNSSNSSFSSSNSSNNLELAHHSLAPANLAITQPSVDTVVTRTPALSSPTMTEPQATPDNQVIATVTQETVITKEKIQTQSTEQEPLQETSQAETKATTDSQDLSAKSAVKHYSDEVTPYEQQELSKFQSESDFKRESQHFASELRALAEQQGNEATSVTTSASGLSNGEADGADGIPAGVNANKDIVAGESTSEPEANSSTTKLSFSVDGADKPHENQSDAQSEKLIKAQTENQANEPALNEKQANAPVQAADKTAETESGHATEPSTTTTTSSSSTGEDKPQLLRGGEDGELLAIRGKNDEITLLHVLNEQEEMEPSHTEVTFSLDSNSQVPELPADTKDSDDDSMFSLLQDDELSFKVEPKDEEPKEHKTHIKWQTRQEHDSNEGYAPNHFTFDPKPRKAPGAQGNFGTKGNQGTHGLSSAASGLNGSGTAVGASSLGGGLEPTGRPHVDTVVTGLPPRSERNARGGVFGAYPSFGNTFNPLNLSGSRFGASGAFSGNNLNHLNNQNNLNKQNTPSSQNSSGFNNLSSAGNNGAAKVCADKIHGANLTTVSDKKAQTEGSPLGGSWNKGELRSNSSNISARPQTIPSFDFAEHGAGVNLDAPSKKDRSVHQPIKWQEHPHE